ncbi:hypothetical protein [Pseudonocardia sp. H11422]|uniref:hypothetical protein n=1 Tax=Pseudonocardia sp. H11422 TaxID=2835866 RepID=UPI001BDC3DAA|nr:hypothetical protein [Pseudonocardia sp. H11422]
MHRATDALDVVQLGAEEFGQVLRRVERSRAQGALLFLVGMDAVRFDRGFTEMRLHDRCARLGPLMDGSMLLATGAPDTTICIRQPASSRCRPPRTAWSRPALFEFDVLGEISGARDQLVTGRDVLMPRTAAARPG